MTKKKRSYTRLIVSLWVILFTGIAGTILFFTLVANGLFGPLPDVVQLENPDNNEATEIISADGKVLGKYYRENRTMVSYHELSPHLVEALVATEDERYFDHSGIDFKSLARAVVKMGQAGGGSTITQQLAKMLFTGKPAENILDRITQKFKEWVIALELERRYTKEEILAMYFNRFDFLNQAVGIHSASKIYFNTTPKDLTLDQSATLVGMAKNPSLYNPLRFPENNHERRNVVFYQMERNDYITSEQKDSLYQVSTALDYSKVDHNEGLATYFREQLRLEMHKWCDENGYNLYTDGLKIYTTIDSRMQSYAEKAVEQHLSDHQEKFFSHWKGREPWGEHTEIIEESMQKSMRYQLMKKDHATDKEIKKAFETKVKMKVFTWDNPQHEKDTLMSPLDSVKYYQYILQCGFLSINPHSGAIKAWVGGIDHKYFKYDHVNLNATRQVGSTFKPFVYSTAVDNGYSPCFKAPNEPVTFEEYDNWTPRNAGGPDENPMQLKKALALSVNYVTAYLMKQLGPNGPLNVIKLARKMGIQNELQAYPSICLGTMDLSVYEMIGAFGTFANKGVFVRPMYITKIEDKNGTVVYSNLPETEEAMSEQTAYVMLKMMERATFGTAAKLRYKYNITNPVACKTGTTQNQSDGWFIGVTPDLVSGGWVGNDHRAVHFRNLTYGSGSAMSMPIWAYYMKQVYADESIGLSQGEFEKPKKDLTIEVDCDKYIQPGTNPTNSGNPFGR